MFGRKPDTKCISTTCAAATPRRPSRYWTFPCRAVPIRPGLALSSMGSNRGPPADRDDATTPRPNILDVCFPLGTIHGGTENAMRSPDRVSRLMKTVRSQRGREPMSDCQATWRRCDGLGLVGNRSGLDIALLTSGSDDEIRTGPAIARKQRPSRVYPSGPEVKARSIRLVAAQPDASCDTTNSAAKSD